MKNKTIGLITARGGSVRLPRKNTKEFCGHPLVAWSIMQSKCSGLIDETVLTTDDDEIAEIGEAYGAHVLRRPILGNDVTAAYVLNKALNTLEENGMNIGNVVTLLPTSPLKKPDDLDKLIDSFLTLNERDPSIENMETYSPDRENYLYENIDDMKNRYGVAYALHPFVKDKLWKYSKYCGGFGVGTAKYFHMLWDGMPMLDSVIDNNLGTLDRKEVVYGYALEPWQCFETDYDSYFKMAEVLMDQFILQGRGMSVYTEYAKEWDKIVAPPSLRSVLSDSLHRYNIAQQD
jgi:hypothetical protein